MFFVESDRFDTELEGIFLCGWFFLLALVCLLAMCILTFVYEYVENRRSFFGGRILLIR